MNWLKINKQADQYRQNPPGDTWDKIAFRLSATPENKIKPWAGWMKYAAAVIIISGSVWMLKNPGHKHETVPAFEVVQEDQQVSPIYTSQNMVALKAAYTKAGISNPTRSKSGM